MTKLFKFFGKLAKSKDINKGGMGLGLSISKLIVNQLGGDIVVNSVFKQGTKFSFTIPILAEEVQQQPLDQTINLLAFDQNEGHLIANRSSNSSDEAEEEKEIQIISFHRPSLDDG